MDSLIQDVRCALATLRGTTAAGQRWLSHRTYYPWLERSTTLDAAGGYARYEYTVHFGEEPARIFGGQFTPSVFDMLGATPALGRFFGSEAAVEGRGAHGIRGISPCLQRSPSGLQSAVIGGS